MGNPMKIRTKLDGDVVLVRVLMSHVMETGLRKTPEGELIPAYFIQTVNVQKNLTNPRWIVFGGSYSGSLAALFRLRYPDLTLGAVASSAPIQAKTDFLGTTLFLGL